MIEIRDVHKTLAGQTVLDGVDITIESGTIVSLLGGSGSGKSVLLKNVVGLMTPDRGEVFINDKNVHAVNGSELQSLREQIGMLFQGGALFDSMTVFENLAFPLRELTDMTSEAIRDRIGTRLEMVELSGAEEKYPAELSGGMQKRVALARTLIRDPDIVFFDEPTTGLDPMIANAILRLIYRLHKSLEFTAIIVTHNFEKVFHIVQKVAMLYRGQIVANEPPDAFMNNDHEAIRSFVQEAMEGPLEALDHESAGD